MKSGKQPYILSASASLIGICFVIVTGLKLSKVSDTTWADELSMFASLCLMGSCLFSYISMRSTTSENRYENIADLFFMIGLLSLFTAVLAFAYNLF